MPTSTTPAPRGVLARGWTWSVERVRALYREVAKFGVIGIVALIVDVGSFNLLLYTSGSPMEGKPLTAKAVAMILATTVAFVGNRYWTFRHRHRLSLGRGYILFFIFNVLGMGIALACLFVSHYLLGLTGPLADNISANVVGLVLGTIFRFWSYRRFVFPEVPDPDEREVIIRTAEI